MTGETVYEFAWSILCLGTVAWVLYGLDRFTGREVAPWYYPGFALIFFTGLLVAGIGSLFTKDWDEVKR